MGNVPKLWSFLIFLIIKFQICSLLLYPQESESREIKDLSGLWWFVLEPSNSIGWGFKNDWWSKQLSNFENVTKIPVPSSFNDLSASRKFRDHVGWAWYQKDFHLITSWASKRVVLRFGSVNYFADVWLNGANIMNHTGGHLPFEIEVTKSLIFGSGPNILTVAVNNTLSHETIPSGEFQYKTNETQYPSGFFVMTPNFDFFNYAGIHRPVWLYSTPKMFIKDITIITDIKKTNGYVNYSIEVPSNEALNVTVSVHDKFRAKLAEIFGTDGIITIKDANFWWPAGTPNKTIAYLYTLEVKLFHSNNFSLIDIYRLKFGIRTVKIEKDQFLLNGRPFYFKGCGMHEDSVIIGRGYNPAVMIKDSNLLEWINANSFRTSHYPYAEERLLEADRRGFVVISETPAVGLSWYTEKNLELHKKMLKEMIDRDKNHPSIVMWSLANEPAEISTKEARSYFKDLSTLAKRLDKTRPITIVYGIYDYTSDNTADLVDVISVNRYFAWYRETGHPELIPYQLTANLLSWHKKHQKPMLVTEYGADTINGLHQLPPTIFTEEYQIELMSQYHFVFDQLKSTFLIGEMFWNFADFMTDQSLTRVVGNRKGIFTRDRQPKMAAHLIRHRYGQISSFRAMKNGKTSEKAAEHFYHYLANNNENYFGNI